MSSLQERFEQAQKDVNSLSRRPDNETMLKLYALYKQATKGDVSGEQPGGFDFVARAKYDAWSGVKGTPPNDAMQQYIDFVSRYKAEKDRAPNLLLRSDLRSLGWRPALFR
jgi:acyl-CoA-binding protein